MPRPAAVPQLPREVLENIFHDLAQADKLSCLYAAPARALAFCQAAERALYCDVSILKARHLPTVLSTLIARPDLCAAVRSIKTWDKGDGVTIEDIKRYEYLIPPIIQAVAPYVSRLTLPACSPNARAAIMQNCKAIKKLDYLVVRHPYNKALRPEDEIGPYTIQEVAPLLSNGLLRTIYLQSVDCRDSATIEKLVATASSINRFDKLYLFNMQYPEIPNCPTLYQVFIKPVKHLMIADSPQRLRTQAFMDFLNCSRNRLREIHIQEYGHSPNLAPYPDNWLNHFKSLRAIKISAANIMSRQCLLNMPTSIKSVTLAGTTLPCSFYHSFLASRRFAVGWELHLTDVVYSDDEKDDLRRTASELGMRFTIN